MKQFKLNDEVFVLIDGEITKCKFRGIGDDWHNKGKFKLKIPVEYNDGWENVTVKGPIANTIDELLEKLKEKYEESFRPESKYKVGDEIYIVHWHIDSKPSFITRVRITKVVYNGDDYVYNYKHVHKGYTNFNFNFLNNEICGIRESIMCEYIVNVEKVY